MKKSFVKTHALQIISLLGFCAVIAVIFYAGYVRERRQKAVFKSQYTFSIRISTAGELVSEEQKVQAQTVDFGSVDMEQVAMLWVKEYLNQFTGKYVPVSKALKNYSVTSVEILNQTDHVVLVDFSAEQMNSETDYFSSWDGYIADGKLTCEWVVRFAVDNQYDGTADIYVATIQRPDEYGLATYEAGQEEQTASSSEVLGSRESSLYRYEIRDNKLLVTFDGGERWITVPADIDYLTFKPSDMAEGTNLQEIDSARYVLSGEKAAFLYGGNTVNGKSVPLTIIYTNDKGNNWISSQVADLTNVEYSYVDFFSAANGTIVVGYYKNSKLETSIVLKTTDGGETWKTIGSTPLDTKMNAVRFADENTGFISYTYTEGIADTLYVTFDGGETFAPVALEAQQLSDNSDGKIQWNDVFIQKQVPSIGADGKLSLLVTQGSKGTYNGGNIAARYSSSDNGKTWKYQEEIDTNAAK